MNECAHCGKPMARRNKKFCDAACSRAWHSKKWHENNPKTAASQLAVGTIGSMNLMRVQLDLVQRGYLVYRATFESQPFELVTMVAGLSMGFGKRVKVTTGHRAPNGALTHRKFDDPTIDVLAVVTPEAIYYEPEGAI